MMLLGFGGLGFAGHRRGNARQRKARTRFALRVTDVAASAEAFETASSSAAGCSY